MRSKLPRTQDLSIGYLAASWDTFEIEVIQSLAKPTLKLRAPFSCGVNNESHTSPISSSPSGQVYGEGADSTPPAILGLEPIL